MTSTLEGSPTSPIPRARHAARPPVARFIRLFAVPIVLVWIAIIAILNTTVPQA